MKVMVTQRITIGLRTWYELLRIVEDAGDGEVVVTEEFWDYDEAKVRKHASGMDGCVILEHRVLEYREKA